jgi:hypothetical protein
MSRLNQTRVEFFMGVSETPGYVRIALLTCVVAVVAAVAHPQTTVDFQCEAALNTCTIVVRFVGFRRCGVPF